MLCHAASLIVQFMAACCGKSKTDLGDGLEEERAEQPRYLKRKSQPITEMMMNRQSYDIAPPAAAKVFK